MVQSQCASSGTPRNIFFSLLFINLPPPPTCLPLAVAHVLFRIETGLCVFSATSSAVILPFTSSLHRCNESSYHGSKEKEHTTK